MKNTSLIALFLMLVMFAITAHSETVVPNTFIANTPAKADEVNANFTKVTTDLNTLRSQAAYNVARVVTITDSTGVGSASCASGEVVVGGGCYCTGSQSAGTNFGTLFSCNPIGKSYLGACYAYLYNSIYGDSPVQVTAICMKAVPSTSAGAAVMFKSPLVETDDAMELDKLKSRLREQKNELLR
ncbi:MAG: hypothetical protein M0R70_05715 [Nitrospirae bacterium]|nr:hypothetical protein [Nitrospirota bacterium]